MRLKHAMLKHPNDFLTIGGYLAYLRKSKGYTIRAVVEAITIAIAHNALHAQCKLSRGYLSSLEAGKYVKPSPFKLQALAYVYTIPSELLLQRAGYLESTQKKRQQDIAFSLLLKAVQGLTTDELQSLMEYIDFLQFKRTQRCSACRT